MISRQKAHKKAYMRTMEAFFAFFITFMFVVFVVLKGVDIKDSKEPMDILVALEQREDFRDCVFAGNESCIEDMSDPFIPSAFNHKISINTPEPFKGSKDIYTDALHASR